MWQPLRSPEMDDSYVQTTAELGRSTFRNLVFAIGGSYLTWHFIVTVGWPETLGVITWRVSVGLALVLGLALWLLPRRLLAAAWVFVLGLIVVTVMAVWLYRQPEVAFFLALVPFLAAVMLSWQAGLLVEVVVAGMALWLCSRTAQPAIPSGYAVAIASAGAVTALVGWSASHALYTAVRWAMFSFGQARENMEEARERRAQLARVVKDLDQAYHRLERANASLVAAWRAADEAERFRAEFVANVSHELRTPLNLIVGFAEMIATAPENYGGQPIPGAYRSDVNAIYHSARHLLSLVDDVLDLARIETGKLALARDWVDLAALVAEVIEMVRDYVTAKGLALQADVEAGLPKLLLDRMRIRQVLLNLLVNAARFTEHGSILVEARQQEGEVVVRVTDTGRGIPKDDLPKVFEEFRTTEEPLSTWHSGTGLGLPISKKFIELHHGRMGVESTYLQGSSFWFTLPCDLGDAPELGHWNWGHPTRRMGASERIVVVVHEDAQVAPLLQRHLDGYRVVGAADMAQGVALVEELKAMALLVDGLQLMPTLPGRTPVIRCPLPSGQRAALAAGAEDMLVKPVSRAQLIAAVDRLGRPVKRVLIADDDPDVVRLFRRMLRGRVDECLEAHNGREALEMMEQHRPDLVLLDLIMPEVDGQQVLSHLGRATELAQIPVVLVTARGQDYASVGVSGSIEVNRAEGLPLGETVQVLRALFEALAPEWH